MADSIASLIPGQRCISNAELQMGLGTVLSVEHRTITVVYLATGETRTYARQSAPLTRVKFSVGDTIQSHDNTRLKVTRVDEEDGLLFYTGIDASGNSTTLAESALDNFLQLNRPSERLFSGQIDQDKWFELRYQTLKQLNNLAHSELHGLTGCRTSLIEHQLYIAHEVATRYAPRVLLADEVGLGKTIEAGLILHHQLQTERAHRVLIIVPETLLHQWLIEMLRRFNLHFKIFDENRCQDTLEEGNFDNVFHSEQLALCSLNFLTANETIFNQCLDAQWDLMVVDEAHHLQWQPQQSSKDYDCIEKLAAQTRGVLLLTATPEQLGKESHFARLRLLDPDRFPNYEQFIEEEKSYEPIAQVVQNLLDNKRLNDNDIKQLRATLNEGDNQSLLSIIEQASDQGETELERQQLVEHLLDRHGTGRVLFRNTRAAVQGFPSRQLIAQPLAACAFYTPAANSSITDTLTPERYYKPDNSTADWTSMDPRIPWLSHQLAECYPEKVLVITASATTALEITQYLKTRTAVHATAFHEGLNVIERDRAAAFFADHETGSQALICSEIGSEGRNFQFAHHLVLFDLPAHPDLLEQRIGRLDRIGQTETIRIYVPYIKNSAQEDLFCWYHQGLKAFEHTCPAGASVYNQLQQTLHQVLLEPHNAFHAERLEQLITTTQQQYQHLTETLNRGRDRLLEYNSCRPQPAGKLKALALQQDAQTNIVDYMENVFDCFGVDTEIHSEGCFIVTPTEHMINHFPGLPDDGMTITYQRDTALTFEDAHYITWEHPLCTTAMDMVLSNENGNTAVTALKYPGVKAGTVLLECLYSLEVAPVEALQTHRYLPPTMIRVVSDERGVDHNLKLMHTDINDNHKFVETVTGGKIVNAKSEILKVMLKRGEIYANARAKQVLELAHTESNETITKEINRLEALSKVNPNIRNDEIAFFEGQLASLNRVLESANLRLDAIRVIVAI